MYEDLFAKRGLSLDRLRVLLEVAEAGGIAKAVGDDTIRQSQYSRQLKELEDFFETELTQRQGKTLRLTANGERLTRVLRESFQALEDFRASVAGQEFVLSIGGGDSLIQWLLLPHVKTLQDRFPSVRIDVRNLRSTEIVNDLHDLKLDVGLVRKDALTGKLTGRPLGTMSYSIFIPKQIMPKNKRADESFLLSNLPLTVVGGGGAFSSLLKRCAEKKRINLNIRLECESFPAACHAVASESYAAILPSIAKTDLPSDQFFESPATFLGNQSRAIALAWNPRIIRMRPFVSEIVKWMETHLRF